MKNLAQAAIHPYYTREVLVSNRQSSLTISVDLFSAFRIILEQDHRLRHIRFLSHLFQFIHLPFTIIIKWYINY
jgi:hypothetical protein